MTELVIKISDAVWNKAKEYGHLDICGIELSEIVMNGVSLPEGHGRLIDADKLRAEYTKPNLVGYDEIIEDIDRQPTVVEGDGV